MTFASFGRNRVLAFLLLASLCLNALLAAYVGTQWLKSSRAALITAAPPRLMELVASRLSKSDADVLWKVFRTKEERFTAAQADYKKALHAAVNVLAEPTLDEEALRQRLTDARNKRMVVGDLVIETFSEAMPEISAEGRQSLVKKLNVK